MQKVQLCSPLCSVGPGDPWAVGVASRLLQHEIRLGLIETALFKHLFMRLASLIGLRRRQWAMNEVEEDKDDDDDGN